MLRLEQLITGTQWLARKKHRGKQRSEAEEAERNERGCGAREMDHKPKKTRKHA
jgi:hypothetical protein